MTILFDKLFLLFAKRDPKQDDADLREYFAAQVEAEHGIVFESDTAVEEPAHLDVTSMSLADRMHHEFIAEEDAAARLAAHYAKIEAMQIDNANAMMTLVPTLEQEAINIWHYHDD